MPEVDGATFLAAVRKVAPDTVRMLLTGHAGVESAKAAINHGQIFRFLTKPCKPEKLREALTEGVQQYQLRRDHTQLVENALGSSVKLLIDLLGLASPVAFGRAARIKELAGRIAAGMGMQADWHLDTAAKMSQIGLITSPQLTQKIGDGEPLSGEEMEALKNIPAAAAELLSGEPRLQPVCEALRAMQQEYSATEAGATPEDRLRGQILSLAADYDTLELQGVGRELALDWLRNHADAYHPLALQALEESLGDSESRGQVRAVAPEALVAGMVFARDLRLKSGTLLAVRGTEVTPAVIRCVRNTERRQLPDILGVYGSGEPDQSRHATGHPS